MWSELLRRVQSASDADQAELLLAVLDGVATDASFDRRIRRMVDAGGYESAALALVERMLPGWGCQVGRPIQTYTSGWYASVFRERLPGEHDMFAGSYSDFDGDRGGRPRDSYRPNGAIAVTLALLRALEAQDPAQSNEREASR